MEENGRRLDEVVQNVKESWKNVPEKTRKIILAIIAGTAVVVLIAVLALNLGRHSDYSTLFTGLSQEEAQEISGLLQEKGIDYTYDVSDGTIRVSEGVVEQTRVELLSSGYPKSGFAYGMYLDNTGLMTTESDKKQISLYDLQDRLGATIRCFEGVQDAHVTIAEATEQRYVLQDEVQQSASASVLITMKSGETLTEDKAQAVKNLVSHAVKGMNFSEVRVFDSESMLEVGGDSASGSAMSTDILSLTSMLENSIAANIRNVLEKLYGMGNVAVSVKGTMNMEKLIQESTQYSTPEKIDELDKTGLLETEDLVNESSLAASQDAGGLVGTDANADTPRYVNEDGEEEVTDSYSSGSASRVWLYNVLKEQRQVDPGILEDTSVAVVITTNDTQTVAQADLYRLVATASGISVDEANDKITIVRAPSPAEEEPLINPPTSGLGIITTLVPLPLLIALIVLLLLVLLLVLFLLLRRRKKKASGPQDEDFAGGDELSASELGIGEGEGGEDISLAAMGLDDDDDLNKSEEILNLRMQRSMRLKQNIAEFVDQNPQIAAKLVQSWLRGEEDLDGGKRNANRRKQSKQ